MATVLTNPTSLLLSFTNFISTFSMLESETQHQTIKPPTFTYFTLPFSMKTRHQSAKPPKKPLLHLTASKLL